jgi:hypothetical protein
MRRDYRERLAEIPRLGPNDGDRAFHRNRDGRGGRAPVNQHHQLRNLSGCPRSTTDAHHMTQSVGSGFVPPDCDGRQAHVTGVPEANAAKKCPASDGQDVPMQG